MSFDRVDLEQERRALRRALAPQASDAAGTVDAAAKDALPSSTGGTADVTTGGAGLAAGPGAGAVPPPHERVDLERLRRARVVNLMTPPGGTAYLVEPHELAALLAVVDAAREVMRDTHARSRWVPALQAALEPFTPAPLPDEPCTPDCRECVTRGACLEPFGYISSSGPAPRPVDGRAFNEAMQAGDLARRLAALGIVLVEPKPCGCEQRQRAEQAERERDVARRGMKAVSRTLADAEARLARVPALVEAARLLLCEVDQGGDPTDWSIALLEELVSAWEQA